MVYIPFNSVASEFATLISHRSYQLEQIVALDLTDREMKVLVKQVKWLTEAMQSLAAQGNIIEEVLKTTIPQLRTLAESVPFAEDHPQVSAMLKILRAYP